MPACFQLISRETNEPIPLNIVDDQMREAFGAEPSESTYFESWYHNIGLRLACGHSFDEIRTEFTDIDPRPVIVNIAHYLERLYIVNCWHER